MMSPFFFMGVQIRVWVASTKAEQHLALAVGDLLQQMATDAAGATLENGYTDIGPDTQLEMLEMQLHAIAERAGFRSWDDDGLSRHLDHIVATEREERARGLHR